MSLLMPRGTMVRKSGGQVEYEGTICAHYYTLDEFGEDGYLRYVVQIHPQGFQYIANPSQLTMIERFSDAV